MLNVLITGGAGFIGSHLASYHLARGDAVLAVDNLTTGASANVEPFAANPRFRFETADIVTWKGLAGAAAEADRIYHMAAVVGMFHVLQRPVEVMRVNIGGCERVLEAAAASGRRPQLVLASSSSVYGRSPPEQMHEQAEITLSPDSPLLNYALSKLANEVQAQAYAQTCGLHVVMARLFNTIGPGQAGMYGFVVPRFVQQALSGAPITVFGDGMQTRSFCDVRDTVAILAALAEAPAAQGKVVNVGNAHEITIRRLAELIRARAGSASPITTLSYAEAYGKSFAQIPQRRPNLDRLHALIAVRPRWTIEATIDDLVTQYGGRSPGAPRSAASAAA